MAGITLVRAILAVLSIPQRIFFMGMSLSVVLQALDKSVKEIPLPRHHRYLLAGRSDQCHEVPAGVTGW
jgi:hypothetical protein